MADAQHLPARRQARFRQDRADAQGLPKLAQGAQHRSFGKLAAQCFPCLGGGKRARVLQDLPQLQHQGRDLVPRGFLRRLLPVRISAQGKNVGQGLAVGEKIRLLGHRAQQIERHYRAGGNEAGHQTMRLLDRGCTGLCLPAPHAGFDEGGCGRRQLRLPRQIKAQGMLRQPTLCLIEGKDGALLLAPVRRPCCLELLCYQESLFSRVIMAAEPHSRVRAIRSGSTRIVNCNRGVARISCQAVGGLRTSCGPGQRSV
jgi:hypothetical protein